MEDRNLPSSRTVEVNTAGAVIVDDDESDEEYPTNGQSSGSSNANGTNGDSDSRDIYLPRYTEQKVSHCALDIGGSLIKIVYFSRAQHRNGYHHAAAKGKQKESSSNGWDAVTSPRQPRTPASHSRPASPGPTGRATPVPNGVLGPESLVSAAANISSYFDTDHPSSSSSHSQSQSQSASSSSTKPPMTGGSKAQRSASFTAPIPGGWLNFAKFETGDIESCIAYLNQLIETSSASHNISTSEFKARHVKIMATGGGAHLFYDKLSHDLGVEVRKEEEMECLIAGLTFFMEIPNEVFWYSDQLVHASHDPATCSLSPKLTASSTLNTPPQHSLAPDELPRPSPNPPQYALVFDDRPAPHFPCLLVNIGSGVSIIKVDDYGKYERISGTSLGGGTLWGLLSLLTGAETFDEMLALSEKGDNANVDMLVGDIYGSDYSKIGLKSSTIASSFGKVFKKDNRGKKFKPEDIAKSLLYAVSNNIGQIAYMNAEKHNLDRIYFGGCFIRGHAATISTLSYAIRFWSKGTKKALFLRHEGYLGAIGAWLRTLEEEQQESRQ